jgi:hypothetical protein
MSRKDAFFTLVKHLEKIANGTSVFFGGFDGEEWITHNVSFGMPKSPEDK